MRPLTTVRSLRFTILVDDSLGNPDLQSEHGLSVWIDADHFRVLFDTGQGTMALQNARRLGFEPAEIDAIAISHGHYDHTGGMLATLAACQKAHVFLHPEALRGRHASSAGGTVRAVGFPLGAGELFATRKEYVHWTTAVTHLHPAVFTTGEIPRTYPAEVPAGKFFLDAECRNPDPFRDEQALAFETGEGVMVFLGCSHAGVHNALECALNHSRSGRLRAVVGGMHLGKASPEAVMQLADEIEKLHPQLVCPCHCTGNAAREQLKRRFPDAYFEVRTGSTLTFN
ncbi:MAG: MBL fold metallo-hydrolase [Spirochaetia bacterium]|jgi:7,8-dihydropterin-6-yl-methyl-4-(beta-D-ribofuranosyl)aminobenzene 5'-phosphate synthase